MIIYLIFVIHTFQIDIVGDILALNILDYQHSMIKKSGNKPF